MGLTECAGLLHFFASDGVNGIEFWSLDPLAPFPASTSNALSLTLGA